ncbi:hypothetical protein [Phyllobacterium brassicacearum]|uniref:hypothetical protein n=1 Tax=Phyllobacterium brassicacearum TaxID=314235 RepID=UPI001FE10BA8|nr:hypothetical protein [Phyllobacterium brassicacearum]
MTPSEGNAAKLTGAGLPIVEVWDSTPSPLDTAVGFSHYDVGALVAEYLMTKGYDRYAQIGANDPRAVQRRHGFIKRLSGVARVELPDIEMKSPSTFNDGRKALTQLLDQGRGSLAVFGSSDVVAHGALTEAIARGVAEYLRMSRSLGSATSTSRLTLIRR